jgi:ATP-dependent helicase/nuclease subunit A
MEDIKDIVNEKNFNRRKVKLNYKFGRLPACKKNECDEELKKCVMDYRNNVKDTFKKLREKIYFQDTSIVLKELEKCRPIMQVYVDLTKSFIKAFREKKKDRNVIDFNDFEQYAIEILVKKENGEIIPTAVAKEMAESFDEVMVDEYQDSNSIQELILSSVSKNRDGIYNRFMVGDVKQSIYGFRGANPDIFIDKYNTYTTDDNNYSGYKIILDKNFRSREGVIQSINFIFAQIMNKEFGGVNYDEENKLYCGAAYKESEDIGNRIGGKTELILVNSDIDTEDDGENIELENIDTEYKTSAKELEAKVISAKIKELVNQDTGMMVYDKSIESYRNATYSDIVILVRSVSGIGEIINDELMKSGIPSNITSKSGYFKTLEISTIISYLKIIDNPMQDIPMAAVLKSPIVGINDEELAKIRAYGGKEESLYENVIEFVDSKNNDKNINSEYNENSENNDKNINDEYNDNNEDCENMPELCEKLRRFLELLNDFRFKVTYMSIYDLLGEILDKTNYYNFVKAMPSGSQRKANIDMLREKAAVYENGSYKGLFNFIRYIEKMNKYEIDMGEASILSEADNAVRIMTIHKSKGLEFPIVFVANINKQFNTMDTKEKIAMHLNMGVGMDYIDSETRIKSSNILKTAINTKINLEIVEEEMRLLYVACTRAREKLIFTASGINENKLEKMTSQRMNENMFLGYGVLANCRSFLDFVTLPLARNKAFKQIYDEYLALDYTGEGEIYNMESNIQVSYINASNIFESIVKENVNMEMNVERLENLPTEHIYDENVHKIIDDKLKYSYPHTIETETNAKMSVSEIKKITYETDNNIDIETDMLIKPISELENNSIKPQFIIDNGAMSGAARGTAYHTVFELFDFGIEPTEDNLSEMIDKIQAMGRLTDEERKCIDIKKLIDFTKSSLGKRMKKAYNNGNLYREAQFVMGMSEEMVEEFKYIAREVAEEKVFLEPDTSKQNGDIILIQGIIDAYFVENGKVVIADYKTDKVQNVDELKHHYYVQLELYKMAVQQITGMEVTDKILYSVKLSEEINC